MKLPTAQQKELEVLYAVASFQSDQVQVLHECAVASGYPLLAGLRDDANGILTLVKKRINALTVMAAKGTAAGIYVADATINPLANSLDDPESRAALQRYHTQELRRDLNTAVWGGRGRGNGRGGLRRRRIRRLWRRGKLRQGPSAYTSPTCKYSRVCLKGNQM